MKTRDERIEEAANNHSSEVDYGEHEYCVKDFTAGVTFGITLGRNEMLQEVLAKLRNKEPKTFGSNYADWLEQQFKAEPQESEGEK